MPIHCPNPKHGASSVAVIHTAIAISSGTSHVPFIFRYGVTWRLIFSIFFGLVLLDLLLNLLVGPRFIASSVLVWLVPAILLFGLYYLWYLRPPKVKTISFACRLCNYHWATLESDHALIRQLLEHDLIAARRRGDSKRMVYALLGAAGEASLSGDFARAETLAQEGASLARSLQDDRHVGLALLQLGVIALFQGDYQTAEDKSRPSLEILRQVKEWQNMAYVLNNLALALIYQGRIGEAIPLLRECLEMKRKMAIPNGFAW